MSAGSTRVVLTLLVAGSFPAYAQVSIGSNSGIANHVTRAEAASARRDFAAAEREWQSVIELDPQSSQARNNLGMVCYIRHEYPEAEAALRKALELNSSLGTAQALLGATMLREAKWDQGIAELERALHSQLNRSAERTARVELHAALSARGKHQQAIEVLKPWLAKSPDDPDFLYEIGQSYLQLAGESFQRIAVVAPGSARLHQILADSWARQSRYKEAIEEDRLALAQNPNLPGVHYQIGALYRAYDPSPTGEEAALREFGQELQMNPYDAWSEYRLGLIYWKRNKPDTALVHFRRAVSFDSRHAPARIALARVLEANGDLAGAEEHLRGAEKADPFNPTTHYRLASLYKRRGDEAAEAAELRNFEETRNQPSWRKSGLARPLDMEAGTDDAGADNQ